MANVLIIDDEQSMCELLASELEDRGLGSSWSTAPQRGLVKLSEQAFDLVVTDLNMRSMTGLEVCQRVRESHPDLPVIVITGFGSLQSAVGAIRAGAYDYITKPFEMEQLWMTIDRALKYRALKREVARLKDQVESSNDAGGMLGDSPAIKEVQSVVGRIINTEVSVLISGESGTGKELIARALHGERAGAFIAVNCAAMPANLLESELFGHELGAFTDAKQRRVGLFLQAQGGTLFLDEIGDMPLDMQVKLLRALQERAVRPIGSDREQSFDSRIVAATNKDLEREVEEGRFREDLYYRLNVVHVESPPLRARGNDVLMLAQRFLQNAANRFSKPVQSISSPAASRLLAYPWPGNVRELENCIERAVALTQHEALVLDDLPERVREHKRDRLTIMTEDVSQLMTLEALERQYIFKVLDAVGHNKAAAARVLGVDRRTLYRKLERLERGPKGTE